MWHPSQSTETKLNGCIVLRLGVAELGEVKKWLIGFGADALVLKPASLRREIAAECQRVYSEANEITNDILHAVGMRELL